MEDDKLEKYEPGAAIGYFTCPSEQACLQWKERKLNKWRRQANGERASPVY